MEDEPDEDEVEEEVEEEPLDDVDVLPDVLVGSPPLADVADDETSPAPEPPTPPPPTPPSSTAPWAQPTSDPDASATAAMKPERRST